MNKKRRSCIDVRVSWYTQENMHMITYVFRYDIHQKLISIVMILILFEN